jgi:Temperature dependent protein affecting M2 dsRNA replication
LIYLQRHPKSYIHAIYGPTDTLLYPGVDKLIISVDLVSSDPSFTSVSKRSIVGDLGVNEEHFLDVGILVGFDHSPSFPPSTHEQGLKATVDMVKYYKSGHAAVLAFGDHPVVKTTQYADQYARTRAMVKYSLILSSEGTVTPLPLAITTSTPASNAQNSNHHPPAHHHPTAADIPSDLHEIFTHRLPDEVYYYLSRGLLGPQALVWLTTGQVNEGPPLDNGDTTEYRRFVKEVITEGQTGPRATTLALISSVCHNFWANRKVTPYFWFEQPTSPSHHGKALVQHNSLQTTQLVERVGGWMVPSAVVEEELRRQNVRFRFLCFVLHVVTASYLVIDDRFCIMPWSDSI